VSEQEITDNTTATTETGSVEMQDTQNQAEEKVFRQEDVDRIVRARLAQVERKYEGVDIEEYRNLKQQQSEQERANMMKREQFEELLQKQKAEADARITQLQSELQRIHVDGALINAASKHKAVNPEHVSNLLKSGVRLNAAGVAEVLDSDGNVRYNTDTAKPVSIDDLVSEFLTENAYFRAAAPAGSGSAGNAKHTASREVQLKDLDMNNPEHRKIFAEKYAVGRSRNYSTK
jgi:DNA-binding transcriptional MerR regulator